MQLTRRYRFSASHRLYSDSLSEAENRATFGKCANPFGHGHDYALDVSVRGPLEERSGRIVDLDLLDSLVRREIVDPMEHSNLNVDIAEFQQPGGLVPTTENLAVVIRRRLYDSWPRYFGQSAFSSVTLEKVRIEETRRNIFEITDTQ
ncbi:MAG: 6-carboxytetrahydropterin synthase [Acidobacteria bacterium]|nr:6-carboxytetrahydropterin synthase [Acidobacteriota bacterium]